MQSEGSGTNVHGNQLIAIVIVVVMPFLSPHTYISFTLIKYLLHAAFYFYNIKA